MAAAGAALMATIELQLAAGPPGAAHARQRPVIRRQALYCRPVGAFLRSAARTLAGERARLAKTQSSGAGGTTHRLFFSWNLAPAELACMCMCICVCGVCA